MERAPAYQIHLDRVVNASKGGYRLLRKGHECMSKDESMGQSCSLQGVQTSAAESLIVGISYTEQAQRGKCFHEKTPNETCPEGFEEDQYDFYAIDPIFMHRRQGTTVMYA